jgi:hypothetical protein
MLRARYTGGHAVTVEEMALPLRRGGDFLQSSSGNMSRAVFDITHRDIAARTGDAHS